MFQPDLSVLFFFSLSEKLYIFILQYVFCCNYYLYIKEYNYVNVTYVLCLSCCIACICKYTWMQGLARENIQDGIGRLCRFRPVCAKLLLLGQTVHSIFSLTL